MEHEQVGSRQARRPLPRHRERQPGRGAQAAHVRRQLSTTGEIQGVPSALLPVVGLRGLFLGIHFM